MVRIGNRSTNLASDRNKELLVGKSVPSQTGNFLAINGELRMQSPDGSWWNCFVNNSGKFKANKITAGEEFN